MCKSLKSLFKDFDYKKYWADWSKEHPNAYKETDSGKPLGKEFDWGQPVDREEF